MHVSQNITLHNTDIHAASAASSALSSAASKHEVLRTSISHESDESNDCTVLANANHGHPLDLSGAPSSSI